MAKKEEKEEEVAVDSREARWEAFLAKHEAQNPGKHAARKAAGELKNIPDSFQ